MNLSIDHSKHYGILLSGGLDSAVLLALILQQAPSVRIQPFTIAKMDGAAMYADGIVQWANWKFGSAVPSTIFVGDPYAHHRQQSTTAVRDIFTNHPRIDFVFNALNQNPPELAHWPSAPQRDTQATHPKTLLPFVAMLKDEIVKLMFANGFSDLMNITHTCTEQQVGRCEVCWQCTERRWAFNRAGYTDWGLK